MIAQITAMTNATLATTASATNPGLVPLEWDEEAATDAEAAACECEVVNVDLVLEVDVGVIEVPLLVLLLLGIDIAMSGNELVEDVVDSELLAAFAVFVDFDLGDLEVVDDSSEEVGVDVGAAMLLSLMPLGIVAVIGPNAKVVPLG